MGKSGHNKRTRSFQRITTLSDLKRQLEALRLAEQESRPSRRRWILAGVVLVALAAVLFAWRTVASGPLEVETVRASVQDARPSAGSPMLTASGYVVLRSDWSDRAS